MKIFFVAVFCLLSCFACTRSNDVKPPAPPPTLPKDSTPVSDSWILDSVKMYTLGSKDNYYSIAKFNYNPQGQLISVHSTGSDTLTNLTVYADTQQMVFTYSGSDTLPSSYTNADNLNIYPSPETNEMHNLTYNNNGLVIKDTLTNGFNPSVTLLNYGTGVIVENHGFVTDSIFMTANNMITHNTYLGQPPTDPSEQDIYQYSAYENPYRTLNVSKPLGALFPTTFLSAHVNSQRIYSFYGGAKTTINYTWTINAAGKVVYDTGVDASSGKAVEYYWFVYK